MISRLTVYPGTRAIILRVLLALLLMAAMMSCGDDTPDSVSATLYDIVTFDGNTPDGAVFTLHASDDSPLVTLTAPATVIDETVTAPGERMLLGYIPASGEPYTSGTVTVVTSGAINNMTLHEADIADIQWDADPIYLNSIWRTGSYINLYCRVSYSAKPRLLDLLLDPATADSPIPELYVAHNLLGQPDSYTRRAYMSADIAPVWNKETCQGVIIHVADDNLPQSAYTFMKRNIN
ncbi:MAG: hypothetical protein NC117_03370 [Pseudoflavonifractor sp.]|nr:hypothetical protein [Pseudoflavonifractor sp.]